MLDRWIEEDGLKDYLYENGIGCIAFSPLAQGILTGKYLNGIPEDSRIGGERALICTKKIWMNADWRRFGN